MSPVCNSPLQFGINKLVPCSCALFGKNLFTLEGKLQPHVDAEMYLTKCFFPEPCAPRVPAADLIPAAFLIREALARIKSTVNFTACTVLLSFCPSDVLMCCSSVHWLEENEGGRSNEIEHSTTDLASSHLYKTCALLLI